MQWNSLAEFFSMGGYALYVWGSFGLTALVMLMEPLIVKQRQSQAARAIRREKMASRHSR